MLISAQDLGQLLGGIIEGDAGVLISGPSKIEEGTPGTISFYANAKYEPYVYTTEASALLVPKDFIAQREVQATLIKVDNVYESINLLLERFGAEEDRAYGISDNAKVHKTAKLGDDVSVGDFSIISMGAKIGDHVTIFPQVFIGSNVTLGNNVTLHPGVKIHHDCIIGNNVVIQSNTVIGNDGFGFLPLDDGSYQKIKHTGNVIIEDNVDIGANAAIDRATMGSTIVKEGAKLDNLIHLAHNVEIGSHTVMAAQSGIAGSTKIGEHCMLGGQSGFVGHIQIADGSKFQAKTGVNSSIKVPNLEYYGYPALKYAQYQRSYVHFRNLPDLAKKIFELEKKIEELEKSSKTIV
jgi:UDP-3-O-[3-hydroxymyristoyl] glucosamine N-acyltransferase